MLEVQVVLLLKEPQLKEKADVHRAPTIADRHDLRCVEHPHLHGNNDLPKFLKALEWAQNPANLGSTLQQ